MGNIYEAVIAVDEELGMDEAPGKEAIPSTTTTAPSTNETGELIRRSLTVIINTNVNVCMLSIDLNKIDANSISAMYLVYGATVVSFIGLIVMKLYYSYVFLQLYFLGFIMVKFSEVPISDAITTTMHVIAWCNFLVVFSLAMGNHFNKTEWYKIESIITTSFLLIMLLRSP